jgi:hypothetical protein
MTTLCFALGIDDPPFFRQSRAQTRQSLAPTAFVSRELAIPDLGVRDAHDGPRSFDRSQLDRRDISWSGA